MAQLRTEPAVCRWQAQRKTLIDYSVEMQRRRNTTSPTNRKRRRSKSKPQGKIGNTRALCEKLNSMNALTLITLLCFNF
jgi:hypothetical protein